VQTIPDMSASSVPDQLCRIKPAGNFEAQQKSDLQLDKILKTEPPLKICVAFDEDASVRSAEILIKHLPSIGNARLNLSDLTN